ncbi:unnamed protein product [Caenorhabditis nigoni]
MRKRQLFIPILICFLIFIIIYLLGSYGLNLLQDYERSEEEKVREWQHKHQPKQDDDVAPPDYVPRTTRLPEIKEDNSEEEIEWITASTRKVPVVITEEPSTTTTTTTTTSPPTTSFVTESTTEFVTEEITESTTEYITEPTTTTSTPSSTTTSTATTATTSTTVAPTTTWIRTWTFQTRRPPIYDPDRHSYGQDRVNHHQHHQHHHHHHKTTTTPATTTSPTTTEPPTTTTRIRVTTPRYYVASSYPSVPSFSSNSIYDRITVPSIPATSSYRNPYIHKIEVTSSTYRTPNVQPTTSTHRQHHHHHHNRTHIDIHSHHRHHIPYPQFPYPHFPNILYPTTSTTEKTTTTQTTEAPTTTEPETTTTVVETTTSRRHHHGSHHGHHHGHHHHSSTARPTTTTTRESELDRWGFVESVEDLSYEEEKSSTPPSTTTTTTSTTTTTTPAPVRVLPERPDVPRHRQPEPPQPPIKRVERDVTIVTGFLDIGRGDWDVYRRPLETYHQFMETLLTLQNNFVVFTDDSTYDFVVKTRTKLGLMDKTKIHKITLNDLPLYGYINEARKIISDELKNETFYRTVADLDMRTHPESISAEYNIVVNSKTHFLHNVTMENPFNSEHFVWFDAGYGHANENHFPYNYYWRPALPDGKISLIKVTPEFDGLRDYDLSRLYRKNVALLSGGFIAGDKHSIGQLHSIIHRKFIQLIYQKRVDDDQTLLTLAVNSFPQLFHVIRGDWFDAFRLFASDPEVQLG